jgi:chromosome segregation ATPase
VRWEEEISRVKTDIHALEIAVSGRKKDRERFEYEVNRLKQKIAVLEYNRQTLTAEKTEAEEMLKKFNMDLAVKDEEEKQINEIISAFNVRKEQSRFQIDEQERYLTGKKIETASLEEKKEADLRTIARLQENITPWMRKIKPKRMKFCFVKNR